MNAYSPSLRAILSTSILALAACGTSTLGGGGTGAESGTGGGSTGGGDLCNGEPSPVSCAQAGCPDGYACVEDSDPTVCHPSQCSCDPTNGWACTADCGMGGSSCVVAPAGNTCNGVPSPVSCTSTSCPAGFSCTPDPDPTTCHPSQCSCEPTNGWACTADCGMGGSSCLKGL